MALLTVRDLSVEFPASGAAVRAVRRVSLSVQDGEVVGLVGESGSGKTAAMMAIPGLLPSAAHVAGSVRFAGRELLGAREQELRRIRGARIGVVFQDPLSALSPTMPEGRQVAEVVVHHLHLGWREARERAVELLASVDLPDPGRRAAEYPHQWSGGMRQRALIAMALAARPSLLIADEPTSALDARVATEVAELLLRLQSELGMAVLLASHDLGLIARLADRVLVMYGGQIVESGRCADVLLGRAHPYTSALMGAVPGGGAPGTALSAIPGEPPDASRRDAGCAFAARCPHVMYGCLRAAPPPYPVPGKIGHVACCWRYHPDAPPADGGAHGRT